MEGVPLPTTLPRVLLETKLKEIKRFILPVIKQTGQGGAMYRVVTMLNNIVLHV